MGGIHGKSKSERSSITETVDGKASTVIDGGLGGDIQNIQITGVKDSSIKLSDHGAIEKAYKLAEKSLNISADFTEDALESVNTSSQRNYDFAEKVAIPLSGQITEKFTQYTIAAGALVAVAMVYFTSKKG